MKPSSILFVCLGNICRSPLAEGVFRAELEKCALDQQIFIDSAGTGGWHVGDGPDRRSVAVAMDHGIDISQQRCRKLALDDFNKFDLILGMDRENVRNCRKFANNNANNQIALMMEQAGMGDVEIPDPYYGGPDGFENAYQMIKSASQRIISTIRTQ